MSAFAAIAGAATAGGMDLSGGFGSMASYLSQKHERDKAWSRMQQWQLIQPGLHMEGLRRAGLNPILAATGLGGGGGGGSNVPQGRGGPAPNFTGGAHAASSAREWATLKAEEKLRYNLGEKAYADATKAHFDSAVSEEMVGLIRQQIQSEANRTRLIGAQALETDIRRRLGQAAMAGAEREADLYRSDWGGHIKAAEKILGSGPGATMIMPMGWTRRAARKTRRR